MRVRWIDTHCHLDAAEFSGDGLAVRERARIAGVVHCVIAAVQVASFDLVRALAYGGADSYCLGIHPWYVAQARQDDLEVLEAQLCQYHDDPRLVAVGEIGLDFFVPELTRGPLRDKQEYFYVRQLEMARKWNLPVVLHGRRSADRLLKHLRGVGKPDYAWSGIAHAFNGSEVQARQFIGLGFKLGFGGALTFERALHIRHLVQCLPLEAMVLETDAPDIPPQWLYCAAQDRQRGVAQGRNTPGELPRIAAQVALLRGLSTGALSAATWRNACEALPRLAHLLAHDGVG
jgi:TatD DNase family protein